MLSGYSFEYSSEKNAWLKLERGISFDEIVTLLESGYPFDLDLHPNAERYPNQRIIALEIANYMYLVPCVMGEKKVFLKTIYPSRKATKHKKEHIV